jgi:DNA-binding response OmpR family regulator
MPEKILVVDDDVDTLRLVGLMLQRQGYQIIAASNGHQALSMAQSENPDLVLLDVMMPDMDGYQVAKELRSHPITSTTPIIMFTAKSQLDDKVAGFDAGVDDYLTKPTQPRELFAHVKAVLSRTTRTKPPVVAEKLRERGHVVGVIAAKGGLGVSTLALNLGVSLRVKTSREVVVGELRPGEGSIALDLGFTHPEGMERLLQKKASEITLSNVEAEIFHHKSEIRLLLASYKPSDAIHAVDADKFKTIVQHLTYFGEYIILDLGVGMNPIADAVLEFCNELVIPMEPTPYILQRTQLLADELVGRGFGEGKITTVIYNRVRTELTIPLNVVQQQYRHSISVVFTPAPELVYQAARSNVPLVLQYPDNLTVQQFYKLSENISKRMRIQVPNT